MPDRKGMLGLCACVPNVCGVHQRPPSGTAVIVVLKCMAMPAVALVLRWQCAAQNVISRQASDGVFQQRKMPKP